MRLMGLSLSLLALTFCMPANSVAQSDDFATATVVEVNTLPTTGSGSGGDAPLASDVTRYDLKIQLGDSVYVCRAKTSSSLDLSWAKGKEIQAKVKGSVMYIKRANGKISKLSIVKTTKA